MTDKPTKKQLTPAKLFFIIAFSITGIIMIATESVVMGAVMIMMAFLTYRTDLNQKIF